MFQLFSGLLNTFIILLLVLSKSSLTLPECKNFNNTFEFGSCFLQKQKQMCSKVQTSYSVQDKLNELN